MNNWKELKEFIEKESEHPLLSDHDVVIYERILDKMEELENRTNAHP